MLPVGGSLALTAVVVYGDLELSSQSREVLLKAGHVVFLIISTLFNVLNSLKSSEVFLTAYWCRFVCVLACVLRRGHYSVGKAAVQIWSCKMAAVLDVSNR